MNLVVENVEAVPVLNCGDIVDFSGLGNPGETYILVKDIGNVGGGADKYILRSLCGNFGACGTKTLEDMRNYIKEQRTKTIIYPSNKFELVLRRKK